MADDWFAYDGRSCEAAYELDSRLGNIGDMVYLDYRDEYCRTEEDNNMADDDDFSIQDFLDDVGAIFTGPIGDMLNGISEFLDRIIRKVGAWIGRTVDSIAETFTGIYKTIEGMLATVAGALGQLWEGVKSVVQNVWQWIKELYENVGTWIVQAITDIGDFLADIYEYVKDAFLTLIDNVWQWLKSLTISLWEGLKDVVATVWDWLKSFGKWLFDGLSFVLKGIADFFAPIAKWIADAIAEVWQPVEKFLAAIYDWLREPVGPDLEMIWSAVEPVLRPVIDVVDFIATEIRTIRDMPEEDILQSIMKPLGEIVKMQIKLSQSIAKTVLAEGV